MSAVAQLSRGQRAALKFYDMGGSFEVAWSDEDGENVATFSYPGAPSVRLVLTPDDGLQERIADCFEGAAAELAPVAAERTR